MNTDNKQFIEDFQNRVTNYPQYDKIVSETDERRNIIVGAIGKCVSFLNDGVLASGTSSLQRTSIELPEDGSQKWDTSKKILTFNHKGMGRLALKEDNKYTYGTNFSKELSTEMFLKVISDDTLKQMVTNELIANRSVKLLQRFNDVCRTNEEIKELNALSNKYKDARISYVFEQPQEVFRPQMGTKDNEGTKGLSHFIQLDKIIVKQISLVRNDTFTVHIIATPEEIKRLTETETGYSYRNRSAERDDNEIIFRTSDITTSMFLMQFPDEVIKALKSIEDETTKDCMRVDVLVEQVNTKLAEYAVMASLKESD